MGRAPCCDKANVKKGPWSPEEDAKLRQFINEWGTGGNWITLPSKAGLKRCGKSCRLRWINYLKPDIKHGSFSEEEEKIIIEFHGRVGSRWSLIAAQLKGRTDNDIKNYWNTRLKKKLAQEGVTASLYHQQQRGCHMRSAGAPIWSLQPDSAGTIGQTQMANDFGTDIDLPAQYYDRHYSSDSRYVSGLIPGQDTWFPQEQKLEAVKTVKNEIPSMSEAAVPKYAARNTDCLNDVLQQWNGWASTTSTVGSPQYVDLVPQQWLVDLPYSKLNGDLDDIPAVLPQHQPDTNMRVPLFHKETSATSTAFTSGRSSSGSCYGDYPAVSTFSDQPYSFRMEASNRMAPIDLVKSEHMFEMPELPPLEPSESPISPDSCSTSAISPDSCAMNSISPESCSASFKGWNTWGDSLAPASHMQYVGIRDHWE